MGGLGKVFFVSGTDTGVGKTFICGILAVVFARLGLRVSVQKWVSTGADSVSEDLAFVTRLLGADEVPLAGSDESPYCFRMPASPHIASEMEGVCVDPNRIREATARLAIGCDVLLIEGVGGLLVPLTRSLLLADLVAELVLPVVFVTRSGLGTLNHTLLSLEAIRTRGIPVACVVMNAPAKEDDPEIVRDNARTIEEMGKVRVFGPVPLASRMEDALSAAGEVADYLLNTSKNAEFCSRARRKKGS